MAYAHVQSNKGYDYTSALAVAFPSNVTAGNLLLCLMVGAESAPAGTGPVTDTRGNTWSAIGTADATSGFWIHGFYCIANGSGANTCTSHMNGGYSSYHAVLVAEYSGIASTNPLDVENKATGSGTGPTVSITTTNANDLVIGWETDTSSTNITITEGSGYTMRQEYEDAAN